MALDSVFIGTNPIDRSGGIVAKIMTSLREHVIDGNSASSALDLRQQPNGSEIIVAGATMEDNHRNLASSGRYLTFVFFSHYQGYNRA